MPGRRAEIRIDEPPSCQIAAATDDGETTDGVARSSGDDVTTEEVTLPADADPEGMAEVFTDGDRSVYRFDRPADQTCVCEVVEDHGAPLHDVRAEDGSLVLTFHVPDSERLRGVVADLRAVADGVSLVRLTRSSPVEDGDDLVFLDRAALTDRQREVLQTAHEMGYFARPRDSNATEVAAALDITRSTFAEHLAAAQSKLMDAVLDG